MAKVIRKICVKFFTIGNKRSSTSIVRAGKNKGFTEKGIQKTLELFAEALERRVPGEDFRLVCVGAGCYNFVHVPKEIYMTTNLVVTGLVDHGEATVPARMQGVDCPECEDGSEHEHPAPEHAPLSDELTTMPDDPAFTDFSHA